MGQPVVHFEVIGKDGVKLQSYYSDLFGWEIDSDNPMNYGMVQREGAEQDHGADQRERRKHVEEQEPVVHARDTLRRPSGLAPRRLPAPSGSPPG